MALTERKTAHTLKNTLINMEYLVKDKKLELKYAPNKGAWTYHIEIHKQRFAKTSGYNVPKNPPSTGIFTPFT
jgi:hypothetical protein